MAATPSSTLVQLEIKGYFLSLNTRTKKQMTENSDSSKKLGISMLVVAWLGVTILLILFFQEYLSDQQNPNRHPDNHIDEQGLREVRLQANRQHHYMVSGTINSQPLVFMVDTGATRVAIPEALAERLGLPKGMTSIVNTANGRSRVFDTSIDELNIGAITLREVPAVISPGMDGEVALLGMSALKRLQLSQRDRTLILRQ